MLFVVVSLSTYGLFTSSLTFAEYNPTTGRFLQRDPLGMNNSLALFNYSLYGFVQFDPFWPAQQYKNGMNLYVAYFVPTSMDPYGTFTIKINFPSLCYNINIDAKITDLNITSKKALAVGACFGVKEEKILESLRNEINKMMPITKALQCPQGKICRCKIPIIFKSTLLHEFLMYQYGGGLRAKKKEGWINIPLMPFIGNKWLPSDPPEDKKEKSCEIKGKITFGTSVKGWGGTCR